MSKPNSEYTYNIVRNDGDLTSATVLVLASADTLVATVDNPNFRAIVAALVEERPLTEVEGLFDLTKPLTAEFARLSDRVTIENGIVYFDGDEQSGPVVDTIVRFHAEGTSESFQPLVNFLDKIGQNPNEHSREHLGRWLTNRSFSLDADGNIIAYKAVWKVASDESITAYRPGRKGPGVSVNDVPVPESEYAIQKTGDIVSMARSEVEFDPRVACSRGLHIGTYRFAREFGGYSGNVTIVEVRVNPRDVVSVPVDANDQKMRACKYEVLGPVTQERKSLYTPIKAPKPVPAPAPVVESPVAPAEPQEANQVPVTADYAEYRAKDFAKLTRENLRAVAKAWKSASNGKVVVKGGSKEALAKGLAKQAGNIRWNRKRGQGFQG